MAGLAAALAVFFAALGALLILRWVGGTLTHIEPTTPGQVPYLGGGAPATHAWSRFHARYYAMALLFLAFDMEMVFMYPWAVVFMREGLTAMVEMLMFILILVLGILYAWREKALEWA